MTWDQNAALHQAVLNAARRITDNGLQARILAAEGRHIVAEHDARLRAIGDLMLRPWRDPIGILHCPGCGGILRDNGFNPVGLSAREWCTCPRVVESEAA